MLIGQARGERLILLQVQMAYRPRTYGHHGQRGGAIMEHVVRGRQGSANADGRARARERSETEKSKYLNELYAWGRYCLRYRFIDPCFSSPCAQTIGRYRTL